MVADDQQSKFHLGVPLPGVSHQRLPAFAPSSIHLGDSADDEHPLHIGLVRTAVELVDSRRRIEGDALTRLRRDLQIDSQRIDRERVSCGVLVADVDGHRLIRTDPISTEPSSRAVIKMSPGREASLSTPVDVTTDTTAAATSRTPAAIAIDRATPPRDECPEASRNEGTAATAPTTVDVVKTIPR